MTACSMCGTTPPSDGDSGPGTAEIANRDDVQRDDVHRGVPAASTEAVPLTWVTSRENGQHKVYCPGCARTHLRAIEAKLDSAWW